MNRVFNRSLKLNSVFNRVLKLNVFQHIPECCVLYGGVQRRAGDPKWRAAAAALLEKIAASPADFPVYPKGVGLVCVAQGGFAQGEYLGDYLGEVGTEGWV